MAGSLHGNARTTPRIRAELQASKDTAKQRGTVPSYAMISAETEPTLKRDPLSSGLCGGRQ